jgi:hypothetical protein
MPNKFERQLLLARHHGTGIIHTLTNVSPPGIPDRITFDLWQRNLIVNSSVLIRKATFGALSGFFEYADLRVCEGYNLWPQAATEGVISGCTGVSVQSLTELIVRSLPYWPGSTAAGSHRRR